MIDEQNFLFLRKPTFVSKAIRSNKAKPLDLYQIFRVFSSLPFKIYMLFILLVIKSSHQVLSTYIGMIASTTGSPEFIIGACKSFGNTPK